MTTRSDPQSSASAFDPAVAQRLDPRRAIGVGSAPAKVDVLGALGVDAGGTLAQITLPRRVEVAIQFQPVTVPVQGAVEPARVATDGDAEHPPTRWPRDVAVAAERHALTVQHLDSPEWPGERTLDVPIDELLGASQSDAAAALATPERHWAWPAIAAWWSLLAAGRITPPQQSATIVIRSRIPRGAEQGSSVALIAAVIEAYCAIAGCKLDPSEHALYIQRADRLIGPGQMVDAWAVLHAPESATPQLLWLNARPNQPSQIVELPSDLRLLALTTSVPAQRAADTVRELRLAGAMGLRIIETVYRDLGQRHTPLRGYLANLSPSLYRTYFRNLLPRRMRGADYIRTYGHVAERAGTIDPQQIYRVRTAVDHLISENEYAESFIQAIEELDDKQHPLPDAERELVRRRAGRLMLASHHSYRLRLELSVHEADWLVDTLTEFGPARGIYGARISGSGGGGTVVALLARSSAANDAILDAKLGYQREIGSILGITEAGGAGSGGVRSTRIIRQP
jgi:galactokinase